ncbi:MAG: hypothetical protein AAF614_19185, partial [Chloroflexota bacterium]
MKFINHRLILAVLFGLIVFVTSSPFGIETVAAQSAPADCTNINDFTASVATTDELDSWIVCFNQAPAGTHTINLTQEIYMTGALTPINNSQSAELIINGNGFDLDAHYSYRHFIIMGGSVTVENIRLYQGRMVDTLCGDFACAASVFVDSPAVATFNNMTFQFSEYAYRSEIESRGGALFVRGLVNIHNSNIDDSRAYYGGGIYVDGGVLNVYSSVIYHNEAESWGGGIYSVGGPVNL